MFSTIKQNLDLNCGLMLNWIVWNVTVFDIETLLTLTQLFNIELFLLFNCVLKNLYFY